MAVIPPTETILYEEELRDSFLEYSMSVITSRALPDVRDGLKPVQRRVLYAMYREGHTASAKYTKCAGIVGEVLKRYHPHGDSSVYDTLVRLTQDWVMRYPLVDGQGNFGSIDGDSAAAYRYTEAKLAGVSDLLLEDIKKDTVDFAPNYNNTDLEPLVLPARIPQLLLNGCAGIAVGMATNIPPHNSDEVVDACIHVIDHPDADVKDLFTIVKGPDFPTGGLILGKKDFREAYKTGRGVVKMRGIVEVEELGGGRQAIVITALPYNVNKARLIERIADLVRAKKIDGIQDLRDETDKKGMRIFVGLKKGALTHLLVEKLYQLTPLQSNFIINMVALVGGKPKTVSLLDLIAEFINHRKEVVRRRSLFDLQEAKRRIHILEGLKIIVDNREEYLKKILPVSKDKPSLKDTIEEKFKLTETQAEAIVILPNYRFSGLERDKILEEHKVVAEEIKRLEGLLASEKKLIALIRKELEDVKTAFPDKRRTKLAQEEEEVETETLIPDDPCFVAVTRDGFLKRTMADSEQAGGSRIIKVGDDVVIVSEPATLLTSVLTIASDGTAYALKAHQLPNMRRNAKGTSLMELLGLKEPTAAPLGALLVKDFEAKGRFVLLATREGSLKKIPLSELSQIRRSGTTLLRPRKRDVLVSVLLIKDGDKIVLLTNGGRAFVIPAAMIPVATKGVGGTYTPDSLSGHGLAGAGDANFAIAGVTAAGAVFGASAKDFASAGAGGVSLKTFRKDTVLFMASLRGKGELVVLRNKSEPEIVTIGARPGQLDSQIELKKTEEITGVSFVPDLADQMNLPIA